MNRKQPKEQDCTIPDTMNSFKDAILPDCSIRSYPHAFTHLTRLEQNRCILFDDHADSRFETSLICGTPYCGRSRSRSRAGDAPNRGSAGNCEACRAEA